MQTTQQTIHNALLAHGFVQEGSTDVDGTQRIEYSGNAVFTAKLQTGEATYTDASVEVVGFTVEADNGEVSLLWVQHTLDETDELQLYAENSVEAEVSKLAGVKVGFTESGMQDEYSMSMEVYSE